MSGNQLAGKRIGAAIIDSIIVGIIAAIPVAIYMIATFSGLDEEGILDLLESIIVDAETIAFVGTVLMDIMLITSASQLLVGTLYFGLLPTMKDGQTWGKMMLKLKAVNEYGENPSFWKHMLRAIQNWSIYVMLPVVLLAAIFASDAIYYAGSSLSNLTSLAFFASLIMIFAMQDGRGLHDMVAKTRVVSTEFVGQTGMPTSDWVDHTNDFPEEEKEDWNEEKKDEWDF